jgi:NADH-quinone oxidoreductase subunit A
LAGQVASRHIFTGSRSIERMANYLPLLTFVLVAIGFLVVALIAARLFRHKGRGLTSTEPYECGNEAQTFAHDHRFSIRYYLIAVLFVIFDVETVFLFPWAVMFDKLALFGFIEMVVFLAILIVGYVYVWKRGALTWA